MAQLLSVHNLSQTSLQSTQDQGIPNIVLTEDDEKYQRNGSIGSVSINSDISLPKIDGPPDDYNNNAPILKKLQQAPVDLSWENLSFSVSKGWRKKERKVILKDLSGLVTSGELTAIMGPSGAGKSTLMNILSGFLNAKHEGKILVNNQRRNLNMFRKLCCYITQDDYLLPHLTVLESITVAANLKIPSSVSQEERKQMVTDVIEMLGLTECEKTKSVHLSGGQKKRLSIAQELVSNPPVMFFDEPTR
ncbi:ATP-binding cassette sub-family G member 4-like [Centruroides sculpturatus]|uniref:ATP-binding cassette sub-family G member 4-like n=1 Tax=Centruroides sculpturatus TaxID=218467 RepID=UPI000C6CA9B1|nr:ATP-binding cassette sub-family G member 4-like [Centruroides sculpturatus]